MGVHIDKRTGKAKAYGAGTIKRIIQTQKSDPTRNAHTSIAGKPHSNSREQQRRLRQLAKRNADAR